MNDKRNFLLLYLLDRQIQLQITAVAWWLFRRENTFDFAGGRGGGGGWRRCFKHFLKYTYFSRSVKAIIRILPFLCFFLPLGFFFNLLNFYPVTRFLLYSVTRYSLLVTALLCLVTPHNWLWKQQKRCHNNALIPENKRQYCFSRPLKLEAQVRYWTTEFFCRKKNIWYHLVSYTN